MVVLRPWKTVHIFGRRFWADLPALLLYSKPAFFEAHLLSPLNTWRLCSPKSYKVFIETSYTNVIPSTSVGSELSGIPLSPQHNVRARSTEKRRRVIDFNTFCLLKFLQMHFFVKNLRIQFCRFIHNFRAGVSHDFLWRGVSIKFSVNKI